jgi:hypothetical protein
LGFFFGLCCSFCNCASYSSFLFASSTFRGLRRRRRRKTKTKDNNIERILFIRLDFYSGACFCFLSFQHEIILEKFSLEKEMFLRVNCIILKENAFIL